MNGPTGDRVAPQLWTPAGAGGVAVVVLRGRDAWERAARLSVSRPERSGPPGPSGRPGQEGQRGATGPAGPRLVRLRDGAEDLDEALLVELAGDAGLELHLHGSPPLVERVMRLLGEPGRAAGETAVEPAGDTAEETVGRTAGRTVGETVGETVGGSAAKDGPSESFPERAWARVGTAPSELGARILLDQAEGAFAREVSRLPGLAPTELARRAAELCELGRVAGPLLFRPTVALVGPVNAGKSTLFNLLLGTERTVVSGESGTTRDAIAEEGTLGPWPVLLVDTAGRRELPSGPEHRVERAGQELATSVGREADWVLELQRARGAGTPPARPASPAPPGSGAGSGPSATPTDGLLTCCDELGEDPAGWPTGGISARTRPAEAVACVRGLFEARFRLPAEPAELWRPGRAVPVEPRQCAALEELARAAQRAAEGSSGDADLAPVLARLERLAR